MDLVIGGVPCQDVTRRSKAEISEKFLPLCFGMNVVIFLALGQPCMAQALCTLGWAGAVQGQKVRFYSNDCLSGSSLWGLMYSKAERLERCKMDDDNDGGWGSRDGDGSNLCLKAPSLLLSWRTGVENGVWDPYAVKEEISQRGRCVGSGTTPLEQSITATGGN